MAPRRGWNLFVLLCVSCQALRPVPHGAQPVGLVTTHHSPLTTHHSPLTTHLTLAALYLEEGERELCASHLAQYLAALPEHAAVRLNYAELLARLDRLPEARAEFEHFVAQAQEYGEQSIPQRIHSHRRLMEIAETAGDDYGEHLNRGIGLYLLGCERAALPDPEGELPSEGLLCQAAAELTLARRQRPDEARPCWYLHEVWSRLGQHRPAERWLREADRDGPFSSLTAAEQRGLHLASMQDRQSDRGRGLGQR